MLAVIFVRGDSGSELLPDFQRGYVGNGGW
jgi:hypothetical protein